jgi:hypothetical protein
MHDAERGGGSRSKVGGDLQISLILMRVSATAGVAERAVEPRYFALTTPP